jgi:hypothetical protein
VNEGFGGERRLKDRMTSQKSIISIKVKAKFCQGVLSNRKSEFAQRQDDFTEKYNVN